MTFGQSLGIKSLVKISALIRFLYPHPSPLTFSNELKIMFICYELWLLLGYWWWWWINGFWRLVLLKLTLRESMYIWYPVLIPILKSIIFLELPGLVHLRIEKVTDLFTGTVPAWVLLFFYRVMLAWSEWWVCLGRRETGYVSLALDM